MRRIVLASFFICLVYWGFAQQNNQVVIGTIDSVSSKVLGETRKVWVYVPQHSNSVDATKKYPVVYLLDGDGHFHSVTGIIQQLTSVNGNTLFPEMIVVGIPNTDRTRDLTPTHSTLMTNGQEQSFLRTSGGGENFTAFLEKELFPYIESHYPTANHRILIGHSFGGLMAINTLIHHPTLFNTYIAIDPSLWWDQQSLLKQSMTVLQSGNLKGRTLYVSVANTMPAGMTIEQVINDTTATTSHIRSILQFTKKATTNTSGLRFIWKYYPDDNHSSVPLIAEYDALRSIFDFYKPPVSDLHVLTAELIKNHYQEISDRLGYVLLPDEAYVNGLGYAMLGQHQLDKAYMIFKLNIDNYPASANALDSMGDYYLAKSDKSKAAGYFSKSLSLKEVPETRRKYNDAKK